MKVSVIIPNYNHAPYLEQRIESVLNQTYRDFEIIILDDCSTDDSKEVIEKYRGHDKISQIVYNEQNSGSTFKQWEKGIALAKGEWIWIAESDDWCELNFLEEVTKGEFIDSKNIVISYCGSLVFSENRIIGYPKGKYFYRQLSGVDFIKEDLSKGNAINNASMCIFRKSVVPDFDSIRKYKFCGDWLFWIKLSEKGAVRYSGKCLNYFRKHANDVSGNSYRSGVFHLEFLEILKYLKSRNHITHYQFKNRAYSQIENMRVIDNLNLRKSIEKTYQLEIGRMRILKNRVKKLLGYKGLV
jgi:glycosyltransferase involved in cell wall biosynthesis